MTRYLTSALATLVAICCSLQLSAQGTEAKNELLGIWQATSIVSGGESAPADEVKLMRMTFRTGELLIRGNFLDEREVSCRYKLDRNQDPKHFDFTPPEEKDAVLGIYRLVDGKLEICMRRAQSAQGRPKDKGRPKIFDASDESAVLMQFEKASPKTER